MGADREEEGAYRLLDEMRWMRASRSASGMEERFEVCWRREIREVGEGVLVRVELGEMGRSFEVWGYCRVRAGLEGPADEELVYGGKSGWLLG